MQLAKPKDQTSTELPDYKDNPEAYELEEHARPDEMLMIGAAKDAALEILDSCKNASVLDLCCGTGLSLEGIVDHPNISKIVGVDISAPYLEFAKQRFSSCKCQPILINGDAVSAQLPQSQWDIVILASAYHHIEDSRKVEFLSRVCNLIGNSGCAIMAENILPEYKVNDATDYAQSVRRFYSCVLDTAKRQNPKLPIYVEKLIGRVAQYGYDGDYEYKVSLPLLYRDLNASGLRVFDKKKVWPDDNVDMGSGGNYLFIICSSSMSD